MGHFQLLLVNLLKNKMAANLGDVWIFEEGWGQMFVSCISPQEKSSPRCLAPLDKDLLRMHCAVIKVEETNPSHETSTPKRKFCPKKKHCTHWSYQLWLWVLHPVLTLFPCLIVLCEARWCMCHHIGLTMHQPGEIIVLVVESLQLRVLWFCGLNGDSSKQEKHQKNTITLRFQPLLLQFGDFGISTFSWKS